MILLNKTDLVTPAELAEVEARIRGINPLCQAAQDRALRRSPLDEVLDRNAFDLDRILEIEPDFLDEAITIITTMIMGTTTITIITTTAHAPSSRAA